jgi:hypothetical protein
MPMPRENPCQVTRRLIVLGKISNWEGKNPEGGRRQPRVAKRSAPAECRVGRSAMADRRYWGCGSQRSASSVMTTSESLFLPRLFNF